MDESSVGKEEWPPEDDYDALNDETFGDDGEEFNWEAAATSTSVFGGGLDRSKPNGDHGVGGGIEGNIGSGGHHHQQSDPRRQMMMAGESLHGFTKMLPDPEEIKDYNNFDNENALEESISRLVMDDFDDEDEEEAMKSKLRRLGTTTNLNTYFLPPQVANKHMQWLKDTELPGQSSLLGSSVWSMHPTSVPPPHPSDQQQKQHAQQVHHNQPLSSSDGPGSGHRVQMIKQANNRASPGVNTEMYQASSQDNNVFNNIFGQRHLPPNAVPMGTQEEKNQKPVFKTVEEIERELLEGSSPPMSANNQQIPSSAVPANNHRRIMTAEELERELMGPSSPPRRTVEGVISQMSPEQRQSTTPGRSTPTASSTPKSQQPSIPQPMTPTYQPHGFGSPSPNRPPPGLHIPPGMNVNPLLLQHQQRVHQQNMNLNMIPGGPQGLAQRMPGYPLQFPPNFAAQLAFQQHQQLRFLQMNPQLRGRLPFMMPMGHPMGHPLRHDFPMSPGPHGMHSPNNIHFMRPNKTDDPYRGLMNEKDKQRLRNIQIIQLQNDHPYTTDYYSLMFKVRHGVSDPKHQREYLLKLFPKKSEDPSSRNSYQPAHFENSLGKLQAVSALAPKKAIDTVIRVVDSGPTNRSGVKAYRYLLLEVERLYECLLIIQEADIRKTLLLNADDESNQKRAEATRKVIRTLESSDKLSEILSVRKGKMLISRLIPLMEPSVRYSVFSHMIRTFKTWAVGDSSFSSDVDKTYPFLRHCILAAEMPHLITIFNLNLDPSVFPIMVLSKLGFSLIIAAFHRAESIISESLPPAAEELCREWLLNAKLFVVSMVYHMAELPMPVETSSKAIPHLKRFGLSTQDIECFEIKMQQWLDSGSLIMA